MDSITKPFIALISQGCAANFGEGEQIAGIFKALDYEVFFGIPQTAPSAYLLNVCTVKGNQSALKLIKNAAEKFPQAPLIITGCVPQDFNDKLKALFTSIFITDKNALIQEPETVLKFLNSKKNTAIDPIIFFISPVREKRFLGIVPISEGCLDACSYCSTRLVKGLHKSIEETQIIEKIKWLVQDGCREIFLTGQDTGCYGFERNTNLAVLVKRILNEIPGNYKIRLGMGNPRHLMRYAEELSEVFSDARVYRFIHLPVQSGSDTVLKKMNRKHTVREYRTLVEMFQTKVQDICLSTDLIVGFPGETESDFKQTLKLLQKTKPSLCNITRFVARPGTIASKMTDKIPSQELSQRSALLSQEFQKIALENNQKFIGTEETILMEKEGFRKGTFIGRNQSYRPVALQGVYTPGTFIPVKITGAETFALLGKEKTQYSP